MDKLRAACDAGRKSRPLIGGPECVCFTPTMRAMGISIASLEAIVLRQSRRTIRKKALRLLDCG